MRRWPLGAERRAEIRADADFAVELLVREAVSGKPLSTPCPAQVVNISRRGCCLALRRLDCGGFHLHRCLQAPQDYLLEFNLPLPGGDARLVTAELRWLNREPDDHAMPFRAGLALVKRPRA
jgi:hypothetical protein